MGENQISFPHNRESDILGPGIDRPPFLLASFSLGGHAPLPARARAQGGRWRRPASGASKSLRSPSSGFIALAAGRPALRENPDATRCLDSPEAWLDSLWMPKATEFGGELD